MASKFSNLRAILLARCSTESQTELSIKQQIQQMKLFCDENSIEIIDSVRLEGVSGLDPYARTDIDSLIERKQISDDFDLVIIVAVDRLTRGGVKHGFKIAWELEESGLSVTSVCGRYPDDEDDWIKLGMAFHEANADVRKSTRRLQRGMAASILDGRNIHSHQIPYGVDRLYYLADGTLLHRIRNLPNGEQLMLHATKDEVCRKFGKINSKKKSPHYRRQAEELITLVPGEANRVEVVRQIFRRRFVDDWRGYKIAKELNDDGIPAPEGKLWNSETVKKMYLNTTYTGLGICCRRSNAKIGMRSRTLELQSPPKTNQIGRTKKRLKNKKLWDRPVEDFLPVEYPHLYKYLDIGDTLVAKIRAFQKLNYDAIANGTNKRKAGKPFAIADYPLTGLLWTKGTRDRMIPRPSGKVKYYATQKALQTPSPEYSFASLPAGLMHNAVFSAVGTMLSDSRSLCGVIKDTLKKLNKVRLATSRPDRQELIDKRATLLNDIKVISMANASLGVSTVQMLTADHKTELHQIERKLEAPNIELALPINVDDQCERVMKFFSELHHRFTNAKSISGPIVNVVRTFVKEITFDIKTKEVEAYLHIPPWCLVEKSIEDVLRLISTKTAFDTDKAQDQNAVNLHQYAGVYERGYVWRPAELILTRKCNHSRVTTHAR